MKGSRFAIVVLVVAFGAALAHVLSLGRAGATGNRKVIRMVHWQLETGIGEAIEEVATEYSKLHPDVVIQQIPISERGYGSWVTTRLIGGTAPEIIEMGMIPGVQFGQLLLRYFEPLSEEILKPNPYNAGTPLAGVPWKDTYYDGMQGGFIPELLEYYGVPASGFTIRLFYNKTKLRELTGLDRPPGDFREFLRTCELIKEKGRAAGQTLVPIAGAGRYNTKLMFGRLDTVLSATFHNTVDTNLDGEVSDEERAAALVGGMVDFRDPRLAATFRARELLIPQFQPSFAQADRMDAAFLFIQQKALMIASGSWDAASYARQADFEIGICDFAMPSSSDPEFGKFIVGREAEDLSGSFSFGLNRRSAHPGVALDFLKFMSSKPMNDLLNRRIQWIPMIRGNLPAPFIEPFWPRFRGVRRGMSLSVGPRNDIAYEELMNLHACGRLDYEGYLARFLPLFTRNTDEYFRMDRARDHQLSFNQDEIRLAYERSVERLGTPPSSRARALAEGLLSRRFSSFESLRRYENARGHTKLPSPLDPAHEIPNR